MGSTVTVWWVLWKGSDSITVTLTLAAICSLTTLQYLWSIYSVLGPEDTVVSETGRAIVLLWSLQYGGETDYKQVANKSVRQYKLRKC